MKFNSPYFFSVDFDNWKQSFLNDIDGNGRTLFKSLFFKSIYESGELVGFIQYGVTNFGFDNNGEISYDVSYCVIRNFYFDKEEVGYLLLQEALDAFKDQDKIYAFYHYFGMSCFGRHGKLFEKHNQIIKVLKHVGFEIEHENVYYSSLLKDKQVNEVEIIQNELTKGNQQFIEFKFLGNQVGGCELHYINDKVAYLRWIYINNDITGQGMGTKCMKSLKSFLYQNGVIKFDTDTAVINLVAQHFYEKNDFKREGLTRSFYINKHTLKKLK